MPFWPPSIVAGQAISLDHLEPFEFQVPLLDGRLCTINARFNDHCFTTAFEPDVHAEPLPYGPISASERRVFDGQR